MNYASTANIEEVMKFYNLGDKTFETDFSYDDLENFQGLPGSWLEPPNSPSPAYFITIYN